MEVSKDSLIEDIVEQVPGSVKYLMNEGIRCIVCGEPIWGTLEEAAAEKGFGEEDVDRFVDELNRLDVNEEGKSEQNNGPQIDVDKLDTD